MTYRKKLIEVALPLEAINMKSVREKSMRQGHPGKLHLRWARSALKMSIAIVGVADDLRGWMICS